MNCESVRERLVDLHEGLLAADDAPEVNGHLASCAACREAREEIGSLHSRLEVLASGEEASAVSGLEGDAGAATMVSELTMLRIGARRPGGVGGARVRRVLRWGVPLAAAACLCVAVTLNLIAPARASAVTLAQMTENVQKAGSVAFTFKVKSDGEPSSLFEFEGRLTVLAGKRIRIETTDPFAKNEPVVMIGTTDNEAGLLLNTNRKTAKRMPLKRSAEFAKGYQTLIDLGKEKGKVVGEETINGEATRVMEVEQLDPSDSQKLMPGYSVQQRVWVGVASGLPVRFETNVSMPGPDGKAMKMTATQSNFQFDAAYDPSLFSMDAPAGYVVEGERAEPKAAMAVAKRRMEGLARELRVLRERDGTWPPHLFAVYGQPGKEVEMDLLSNPRRVEKGNADGFVYLRPVDGMLADEGVLFEPPCEAGTSGCVDGWSGSTLVGYIDGRVEEVTDRVRYEAMLRRARERVERDNPGYDEARRRAYEQRNGAR